MSDTKVSTHGGRTGYDVRRQAEHSAHLRSRVVKRSILVGGHHTSVSLEDAFWDELRAIAQDQNVALSRLVSDIDSMREHSNLSSAIRLFVYAKHRKTAAIALPQ